MGLFDFNRNAGATLGSDAAAVADVRARAQKSREMLELIQNTGFDVDDLKVGYDDGVVTVQGKVPDQEAREKIVLILGNVQGVAQVDDRLEVEHPGEQARFYEVETGDTLSKIAKEVYGDAMKYPVIFEANRPMLKDPDKIYPGQVLRIPAGG
ncbi:MAG TPA: peptidoglycan-binding protein LysM [Longimicrobiales bacterium]|nr:peptidoglycan-binding protein LysM [Longimicrobiales bacterium]